MILLPAARSETPVPPQTNGTPQLSADCFRTGRQSGWIRGSIPTKEPRQESEDSREEIVYSSLSFLVAFNRDRRSRFTYALAVRPGLDCATWNLLTMQSGFTCVTWFDLIMHPHFLLPVGCGCTFFGLFSLFFWVWSDFASAFTFFRQLRMHFSGLRFLFQFWICLILHPHSPLLTNCGCTFQDSIHLAFLEFAWLCIRIPLFPLGADALFRTQFSLPFYDRPNLASAFISSRWVRMHFSQNQMLPDKAIPFKDYKSNKHLSPAAIDLYAI